jgi:hypothetical protein
MRDRDQAETDLERSKIQIFFRVSSVDRGINVLKISVFMYVYHECFVFLGQHYLRHILIINKLVG